MFFEIKAQQSNQKLLKIMNNFVILLLIVFLLDSVNGQFTYIDYLICYNTKCYANQQNCMKDPICSTLWSQFQKCQKRANYNFQSRQCTDEYIAPFKQTNLGLLIETLYGCFEQCNGQNLFVCHYQLQQFENCQSSSDCYEEKLANYEKNMQICIANDNQSCENYSDINQCHLDKTYYCMKANSQSSYTVYDYIYCRLVTNSSTLLAAKALLGLVITLIIM
ncbi:hypothetical protein ABPG74_007170 [Tetrahymena malaccensis]